MEAATYPQEIVVFGPALKWDVSCHFAAGLSLFNIEFSEPIIRSIL
jgi:hypothetical protein